jgi:hypothetical protein
LEDETQGIDEQQCGWGGEITDEDEESKPAEANMDADLVAALGLDRIEPSGAFPPQGATEVLESEECPDIVCEVCNLTPQVVSYLLFQHMC